MLRADVYRLAASFIEKGFCKEFYGHRNDKPGYHVWEAKELLEHADCFCAMGALKAACWKENVSIGHYAYPLMQFCQQAHGLSLVNFNDHPKTTQAQVIYLFKSFANSL